MIVYDPRGHDWNHWCARMNELFAANQLGTVPEDQWRSWAEGMLGIGYFNSSAVADPRLFSTWQEWAERMVEAMTILPITGKG